MHRERGFTFFELIVVMLITAILAVAATSMFNRRDFDAPAFAAEVRAQIAYAQKLAVGTRRAVTITVAGNALTTTVCSTEACAAQVSVPTLRGDASLTPPGGSNLTLTSLPATFAFNALGQTGGATLAVTGAAQINITVSADTGYAFY